MYFTWIYHYLWRCFRLQRNRPPFLTIIRTLFSHDIEIGLLVLLQFEIEGSFTCCSEIVVGIYNSVAMVASSSSSSPPPLTDRPPSHQILIKGPPSTDSKMITFLPFSLSICLSLFAIHHFVTVFYLFPFLFLAIREMCFMHYLCFWLETYLLLPIDLTRFNVCRVVLWYSIWIWRWVEFRGHTCIRRSFLHWFICSITQFIQSPLLRPTITWNLSSIST